ncbi:hypothetical protein ACN27G_04550 [Plantactinospora sp. WMMB334]|uniref:hypothetical protein n=1 Tax=Plantactinospora sp. WMMB334 TaxID=3404119 RepID=UPI003B93418E
MSEEMPLTSDLGANRALSASVRRLKIQHIGDVESILTLLSEPQPWLSEAENLRNRADFIAFSRTLHITIRSAQVKAIQKGGGSPPRWLSSLMMKWCADQTSVITFNYDTLLEKAFTDTLKSEAQGIDKRDLPWLHSAIYAVPLPKIASPSPMRRKLVGATTAMPSAFPRVQSPTLIKLHGSLNWYYSGSESFFGEAIHDIGVRAFWKSSARDRKNAEMERYSSGKVSLLIPPTAGKSPFFQNETVRAQWALAQQALRKAERIYIVGYSLPPGDHMVRHLLSYTVKPFRQEVVVVNPDNSVCKEVQSLTGGSPEYYSLVSDFVTSYT